jgi:cytochrome c oxidase assembly protein Cox11
MIYALLTIAGFAGFITILLPAWLAGLAAVALYRLFCRWAG